MPIGGKATRARDVTQDRIPKHLIRLENGKTVLDTITENLQYVGFRNFVFCLGHHKQQLIDHLDKREWTIDSSTTHAYSEEDKPLGPDGAFMQAIGNLGIKGQAMIIPGDLMLPWHKIAEMNLRHAREGADITFAVTSHVTPRTTDVGKIIGEDETDRLVWCYPRTAPIPAQQHGSRNLTSAAAMAISVERYQELCELYLATAGSHDQPYSWRDDIMPWAAATHAGFDTRVFDIQGEILDLGTPDNIHYGQKHWGQYV